MLIRVPCYPALHSLDLGCPWFAHGHPIVIPRFTRAPLGLRPHHVQLPLGCVRGRRALGGHPGLLKKHQRLERRLRSWFSPSDAHPSSFRWCSKRWQSSERPTEGTACVTGFSGMASASRLEFRPARRAASGLGLSSFWRWRCTKCQRSPQMMCVTWRWWCCGG